MTSKFHVETGTDHYTIRANSNGALAVMINSDGIETTGYIKGPMLFEPPEGKMLQMQYDCSGTFSGGAGESTLDDFCGTTMKAWRLGKDEALRYNWRIPQGYKEDTPIVPYVFFATGATTPGVSKEVSFTLTYVNWGAGQSHGVGTFSGQDDEVAAIPTIEFTAIPDTFLFEPITNFPAATSDGCIYFSLHRNDDAEDTYTDAIFILAAGVFYQADKLAVLVDVPVPPPRPT